MSRTELTLEDLPIKLDAITELVDSKVFKMNKIESRPAEILGPEFITGIDIQGNLDLTTLKRDGYTFLDVLSDVGGVSSALISVLVTVVSLLNFNHLESYMASRLFNLDQEEGKEPETFTATKCGNLADYVAEKLPNCLVCCKSDRRQRAIKKARATLEKELDVLELVKSMRFFRMAIKRLLTTEEINELNENSQFLTINPD